MSDGVGPKKNTYNRNLSSAAARMVGGNYGRMSADEYNCKPSGSRFTIKDPLPPHKAGLIAKKGDAIRRRAIKAMNDSEVAFSDKNMTVKEWTRGNRINNYRYKNADALATAAKKVGNIARLIP
jgi:hypothetical protein